MSVKLTPMELNIETDFFEELSGFLEALSKPESLDEVFNDDVQ